MAVSLEVVALDKPEDVNVIVGQAHFIKTVEDLHEALAGVSSHLRFGIAFCEASGPCLIRKSGNDTELTRLAVAAAEAISAGHTFVIMLSGGFPVNVMNPVKAVPEVCTVFCATANPCRDPRRGHQPRPRHRRGDRRITTGRHRDRRRRSEPAPPAARDRLQALNS
jgi:adenosine/AMP kinase